MPKVHWSNGQRRRSNTRARNKFQFKVSTDVLIKLIKLIKVRCKKRENELTKVGDSAAVQGVTVFPAGNTAMAISCVGT